MALFDVLACLREKTQTHHGLLDGHLRAQLASPNAREYARYLSQMRRLYSVVERAHRPFWPDMAPDRVNWAGRSKVPWIEADLAACASREQVLRPPDPEDYPSFCLASRWSAWGAAYVIEGSTLGGRVLLRAVAPKLAAPPQCKHRFWTGYGRETGAKWKAFLGALEDEAGQKEHVGEVTEGALAVFSLFLRSISAERGRS